MCIDRWDIGDLITSAYVLSAGEVISRQEGTLSAEKKAASHSPPVVVVQILAPHPSHLQHWTRPRGTDCTSRRI